MTENKSVKFVFLCYRWIPSLSVLYKCWRLPLLVMLGTSIMAAPIYRPGVEHRAVYLPQGTWFDWWTGEVAYNNGNFATTTVRVYEEEQQYIVEIGDRFGNWQPTTREVIVELVGIGKESFIDDGASGSLRFDRVD